MTIEKKSPGATLDAAKPARAPSSARRKKASLPAGAPLAVTQPVQTEADRAAATGGLTASRASPSPRLTQVELLQHVRQLEFELRTSSDALQRTIRELQSFNEELETSSEELHSTNAELTTVNAQLWEKIDALDRANSDVANLLASVDNATLFLDGNGAIQRFTPSATRLFNLMAADVGRPIAHISTRFEDPDLLRDIDQVLHNLAPSEREVYHEKDQWYLRRITPYRTVDDRICGVVLSLTDITQVKRAELKLRDLTEHLEQRVAERTAELEAEIRQRKLAEQALRASEQSLRALIDDAPVGIVQTHPESGRFLMVNPHFCAMMGYSESELLGRSFAEITHPDDRHANLQSLLDLAHGNAPGYELEKRYLRKDGATLWVDLNVILVRDSHGKPQHALGVVSDITERKLLQIQLDQHGAALQRERNFIHTILDTVAALVMVVDPEGRLVRFNTACSTAAGSDFSQFVGSTRWQALIPLDEIKAVQQVIAQLFSGEASVVQHENSWRRSDGSLRLLNWTNTVLKDAAGRIQYVIGTGIDITDQHHAESRVREILEDASRLQRMQTVNELATLLAHELNQPLAAIASYAEAGQQLLGRTPLKQDKLTRNLEQISQQALRAGDVIKHLRAFVGRRRIDPVPLDMNKVVRNTCSLMLPKARSRGIHLVLELADPLPPAMGVEVHIGQVLLNLMRNAIDAIRECRMKHGRIVVTTRHCGDRVQVSVCDSGPGVDAERADKVFEPLASHKEFGLGVGLRISRNLIEADGGRLWVEPQSPGGIFHFVLPLAP